MDRQVIDLFWQLMEEKAHNKWLYAKLRFQYCAGSGSENFIKLTNKMEHAADLWMRISDWRRGF